jgi:membrane-bound serine protease (ClpP class)
MKKTQKIIWAAVLMMIMAGVICPACAAQEAEKTVVYIIPIRKMIEPALLYVIRRGVAEAEAVNADAIIFVMDTPGGTLEAAGKIVRIIQDVNVPTYTFVEKDAYSAGAIIALATKHIYMAPGSVIGAATPMMMSPMGGVQELPEDVEEKMISGVSAKIRAAAEQGGHNKELAEAMVRRNMEFKIDDQVISEDGELLTLTSEEAAQPIDDAGTPLLSAGTVNNVDELLEHIDLGHAEKRELQVTGAERIARFIAGLAPIFLIVGLAGIYIEVKTPGFGLPGIIGITALILFFWGHHIAGLSGMEDMLIFLAGIVLLLLEILVIPGFGIAGITGIALIVWSILSAMIEHYPGMPWYQPDWSDLPRAIMVFTFSLVVTVLIGVVLGRYLPESRLFNRLILQQATLRDEGYTASKDEPTLAGRIGRALCPLRPAGSALFGQERFDVVTGGEYIDKGERVRIMETHGNRIVVEKVDDENATQEHA